jgi:hypothetical protein
MLVRYGQNIYESLIYYFIENKVAFDMELCKVLAFWKVLSQNFGCRDNNHEIRES